MSRSYPRDEIKWDLDTLKALAALIPPQATYFEKADRWVVKQDGKSFGIKPEQIVSGEPAPYNPDVHQADEENAEAALAAHEFRYDFAMSYVEAQIAAGDRRLDRVPGAKGAAIDAIVRQLEDDPTEAVYLQLDGERQDLLGLVAQREADERAVVPAATNPEPADIDDVLAHFGI